MKVWKSKAKVNEIYISGHAILNTCQSIYLVFWRYNIECLKYIDRRIFIYIRNIENMLKSNKCQY